MDIHCGQCGKKIEPEDAYFHRSHFLCENCCMDSRMSRARKTHWRYLGSIKTDYLIHPDDPK